MNGPSAQRPGDHEECYACPVGSAFSAYHGVQPEATEHLVRAAGELLAAFRSLIEAAEQALAQSRRAPHEAPPARLRRIPID